MAVNLPAFANYGAVAISSDRDLGAVGSGFLLAENNHLFLVTANHVIKNFQPSVQTGNQGWFDKPQHLFLTGCSPSKNPPQIDDFEIEINCQQLNYNDDDILDYEHCDGDVCRIKLGQWNEKTLVPTALIDIRKALSGGEVVFTSADFISFNKIELASDVYLLGFPSSLLRDDFPLLLVNSNSWPNPQPVTKHALIRKGILSSKDTFSGQLNIGGKIFSCNNAKYFTTDCPIFAGDSGGPVATIVEGQVKLIGVATNAIPVSHDPLTYKQFGVVALHTGLSIANSLDGVIQTCHKLF